MDESLSSEVPLANRLLYWLARFLFRIAGWRTEGKLPDIPKYVAIVTHTSNWDFVVGLTGWAILSHGFSTIKLSWMGKAELFRGPLGAFLKWIGGVPIERGVRQSAVEQSIQAFRSREKLVMALAPEGTRKKATHWKTGFYYIAQGAQVPIVFGLLDYRRKVVEVGPAMIPSGDIQADVEIIRDFYSRVHARYPDQVGDIILRQR
jgi:1-acyl-sn-glycerol-3-phosphate acyltransferase